MFTRLRPALAALAVFGLAAAACGGSGSGSGSEAQGASNETAAATTAAVLPTASGGQLDLGSLEGTDYVLWFWAPW